MSTEVTDHELLIHLRGTEIGKKILADKESRERTQRRELVKKLQKAKTEAEIATRKVGEELNALIAERDRQVPEQIRLARALDRKRSESHGVSQLHQTRVAALEYELRGIMLPEIKVLLDAIDDHLRQTNSAGNRFSMDSTAKVQEELNTLRSEVEALPMLPDDEARSRCEELATRESIAHSEGMRIIQSVEARALGLSVGF